MTLDDIGRSSTTHGGAGAGEGNSESWHYLHEKQTRRIPNTLITTDMFRITNVLITTLLVVTNPATDSGIKHDKRTTSPGEHRILHRSFIGRISQ